MKFHVVLCALAIASPVAAHAATNAPAPSPAKTWTGQRFDLGNGASAVTKGNTLTIVGADGKSTVVDRSSPEFVKSAPHPENMSCSQMWHYIGNNKTGPFWRSIVVSYMNNC